MAAATIATAATTRGTSLAEPLRLGAIEVWPPVVLAPMAGVTNAPFRSLCRSFGGGLFVSEMVSARALHYGNAKTWQFAAFSPQENPRSLQLYGTDPVEVGDVVKRLVAEGRIDHLDLNFGCPAPKITRRGGGAAIPLKPRLLASIIRAAVANAGSVPVTMKFRKGIDDELSTYLQAGRIGEEEGCAAVALHGRTAAQLYDGAADWNAIGELKAHVRDIPVLGNGDIWEAADALAMMAATGCDGVVVGRGCLGRPWLFAELNRAFAGETVPPPPRFGEVAAVMRRHARQLVAWNGEVRAMQDFRKHLAWYAKGYSLGTDVRRHLAAVSSFADLDVFLDQLDPHARVDPAALRLPRGKGAGRQRVALPDGYLDNLDDDTPPEPDAGLSSGG